MGMDKREKRKREKDEKRSIGNISNVFDFDETKEKRKRTKRKETLNMRPLRDVEKKRQLRCCEGLRQQFPKLFLQFEFRIEKRMK